MTTSKAAQTDNARAWPAHHAARWLGLAASPTFTLMAWIAASDASHTTMCASASGMAWMYLLMSLFHLSPWLKLVSGPARQVTHPTTKTNGD